MTYKRIQETIRRQLKGETKQEKQRLRERLYEYRQQKTSVLKIEKPSNPKRARELGYKARQGIIVARVKIKKGSGKHTRPKAGRRPKRMGFKKLTRALSKQTIAEQRASRRFPNLEVLNSYWVGDDGKTKYFEVILVDPLHPSVLNSKELSFLVAHRRRVFRGLTSSARKSRGLRKKGKGTEKIRPSRKAGIRKRLERKRMLKKKYHK